MRITNKLEFIEFLKYSPIYSKFDLNFKMDDSRMNGLCINDFENIKFNFKCQNENNIQTFSTKTIHEVIDSSVLAEIMNFGFPYFYNVNLKKTLGFIILVGVCQSCKSQIYYFLMIEEKNNSNVNINNVLNERIYNIQKCGQYPQFNIQINKILEKYFDDNEKEIYKKALICLTHSFGIGAYSYLRRILEKLLISFVKTISELELPNSHEIKPAYQLYLVDHQMDKLISSIKDFIPASLLLLGENPIKSLYKFLSEGIHNLPDDICLKKAEAANKILIFIVEKINEEKTQNIEIKLALKNIKE